MLTEVELALAQPRSPEELTRALQSLEDEVRRLITLAKDLLERAGSGDGGLLIESQPVDLVALTARVAERFRAASGEQAIEVIAPHPVEIQGDATRLDRAVSNLIDNALRHGAGHIEVAVNSAAGRAVVTVTDEGDGFTQETSASSPGLGLTIVREVARAHGGKIDVQRDHGRTRVRVEVASLST
jgi:signal transduction histidine kinase